MGTHRHSSHSRQPLAEDTSFRRSNSRATERSYSPAPARLETASPGVLAKEYSGEMTSAPSAWYSHVLFSLVTFFFMCISVITSIRPSSTESLETLLSFFAWKELKAMGSSFWVPFAQYLLWLNVVPLLCSLIFSTPHEPFSLGVNLVLRLFLFLALRD
ncbi:hypothetical protein KIPB_002972 [Kipferlia bialata]|uniref:Transmembrane protein n=1 Tax=Kipferlia bialata TaxID=797122 RepID=A0A9K3GGD4_9EUKA|nr:hypothetical protein KIPB_002972 [Kipferlia bialata]|eukprot:g2972.t1